MIMKKVILCLFILCCTTSIAQNITFSDAFLANLLVNRVTVDSNGDGVADSLIDTNSDGAIQVSEAAVITSLSLNVLNYPNTVVIDDLSNFPNLLNLSMNNFSDVGGDLSLLLNLERLKLDNNQTISINFNSGSLLELSIETNSVVFNSNLSGLNTLTTLNLEGNLGANAFNFNTLNQLIVLKIKPDSSLSVPDISSLNMLKTIELKGNFVGVLGVNNNTLLEQINIPSLQFDSSSLAILSNLKEFIINTTGVGSNQNITSLNFSNSPQLNDLKLTNLPLLNSIDLTLNSLLEELQISNFRASSLNLLSNTNLKQLNLENNNFLSSLDLTNMVLLENLVLNDLGQISIVDVSSNMALLAIDLISLPNLQSIDLTANQQLEWFNFTNNSIITTPIDFSQNTILEGLRLGNVALPSIDLTNNLELENIYLDQSQIIALDLGSQRDIIQFNITRNLLLESISFKTSDSISNGWTFASLGVSSFGTSLENPNLNYICANDEDIPFFRNLVSTQVVVNSYCSFTPGGTFNEIQGGVSIDTDNNGCDPTYPVFSYFNFTATDGIISGSISSNQQGAYYVPVADGQHTITPNPENPTYWNFSPANVVVDFPTQASPFTQDFCVTANGSIEDLEIIVVPLEQARPGFDTDYKVVVKNKGNVTSSGSVTLDFEEDFMTLLSSNPNAGNTPSNQLSWSFSNLQPFQMEEYEFTMTLNTPTATVNPLNGGDMLTFTGTVTGIGTDAMPADNVMVFDQTVVNSYDPNDKTCLEGETIDPSDVGEYVHYMIRFENTGTASAVNIVVKDEIDLTQFDISTLIPLGGSHDYYTRVRDINVVEFIHEDINLDFNDATNDGYVLFKIKTLNTLVAGDTFDNTAEIFFDFNFPIITNTETVTVMSTASIGETTDSSIKVHPNPASSFINLSAANRLKSATIIDINGRMLSQTNFTGNSTDQRVSLENLSSGIYFVTIQSDLGQKVEKLIVE
ncbi:conserved hypothetical protein [Flavobacteria bacterium BBFL7]|nr:conserved hypothetical protein [Flavobacteria bacterium BBFL7]